MSKKVKCGECYCLMQWMLPQGVTKKNYEYAKVRYYQQNKAQGSQAVLQTLQTG